MSKRSDNEWGKAWSREDAMSMILCYGNEIKAEVMDDIKASMIKLPPVQQKTGHWVKQIEDNHDGDKYMCSCCGEIIRVKLVMGAPQYITCPMCGAKMESEEQE